MFFFYEEKQVKQKQHANYGVIHEYILLIIVKSYK